MKAIIRMAKRKKIWKVDLNDKISKRWIEC